MAKFKYEYNASTDGERREIERIRAAYAPKDERAQKLERLKELNERAKRPANIAAITAGTVGTLLFGLGMCLCIEWNELLWGIVCGLCGIAILACALPLHSKLQKRGKEKYGKEILELSEELLKDE